jgi:hypothetical protein
MHLSFSIEFVALVEEGKGAGTTAVWSPNIANDRHQPDAMLVGCEVLGRSAEVAVGFVRDGVDKLF